MKSQPSSADLPYETEHEESINNEHEPILELVGISKTYTRADTPVLHNLDLRVYPGDMLAIIGPSGSGKSGCARPLRYPHARQLFSSWT